MPVHPNAAALIRSSIAAGACVALVGACSSPQNASTVTGTTPAVWTGSSGPSAEKGAEGGRPQAEPQQQQPPQPQAGAPAGQVIMTKLKGPDGTEVATAKFEFSDGYATVTIATTGGGHLSPGFHGVHVHKTGKCEPNSTAPTGGAPGDFLSAGGHFQAPGHSGEPASGDLTSLQVRKDGTATLMTTTDAFTMQDLTSGEKTAIVIHAGSDNFGNIPPERYSQINGGAPGPDQTTMTTGDAGKRVACGVIGAG